MKTKPSSYLAPNYRETTVCEKLEKALWPVLFIVYGCLTSMLIGTGIILKRKKYEEVIVRDCNKVVDIRTINVI